MSKRPEIGDIIEIQLPGGQAQLFGMARFTKCCSRISFPLYFKIAIERCILGDSRVIRKKRLKTSESKSMNECGGGEMLLLSRQSSVYIVTRSWLISLMSVICLSIFMEGDSYANESSFWNVLKSGNHFAMVRHAIAPGMGDPQHFKLGNCSTQRNLSTEGRNQAKAIGERFRANGIDKVAVFSSQWCRCLETAKLLALGPVQELPALNSFFQEFEREELQTQMLKEWLLKQNLTEPILLVTHQVNITALTNVYPASGELVIVRQSKEGEFKPVGRFQID